MKCMAQGLEEAKAALTKVKDEYAIYYNHQCKPAPVFTPGDRVWLDGSDIATNRPSSKLSHQCLGLFVVEAYIGHGVYYLTLPPYFHYLHLVFCQGTLAAVPTQVNIHMSTLNKGGSSDPGAQSAVSHPA
jgi:hypothetical protein